MHVVLICRPRKIFNYAKQVSKYDNRRRRLVMMSLDGGVCPVTSMSTNRLIGKNNGSSFPWQRAHVSAAHDLKHGLDKSHNYRYSLKDIHIYSYIYTHIYREKYYI